MLKKKTSILKGLKDDNVDTSKILDGALNSAKMKTELNSKLKGEIETNTKSLLEKINRPN